MFRRNAAGFTLIELLVVISIIALLIAILLPVLGRTRHSAQAMQCMNNMKQIEVAHYAYMTDNKGALIDASMSHGGFTHSSTTFVEELNDYWSNITSTGTEPDIIARSPLDDSPHWGPAPAGQTVPGATDPDRRRRTSYGLNDYLTTTAPVLDRHTNISQIKDPTSTVHVFIMIYQAYPTLGVSGDFAGADHAHSSSWFKSSGPPSYVRAALSTQTNAVSGDLGTATAVSNYAFLDGHVEQLPFRELGTGPDSNNFNPDATP